MKYLHYGDIHTSERVYLDPTVTALPSLAKDHARRLDLLSDGDLVFVDASEDIGGVGKSVEITGSEGQQLVSGLHTIAVRFNKAVLGDGFKAQLQFCPRFRDHLRRLAAGTKVYATNRTHIASAELRVPPLPEQQAIAAVLMDVDALIGSLEALIGKKRAIKRAAMQQLLTGRTRLRGFDGEWETTRLGDLARIATGTRNNQDKSHDGRYPFFVRSSSVERIDSFAYDCEAILIPGEGRIGEIFHYVHGRFDVHQRVYAISDFRSSVFVRFLYYYIAEHFGAHALKNTVKATVDSLRRPTFLAFRAPLPPVPEQRAIAAVLTDMDAEIAALERRLDKTRAIKQGMIQQLLTGAVRLPVPDDELKGESHDA